VQSFVQSNVPVVSGVALVQLHSVEIARSKQTVKVIKAKKSFMVGLFTGSVFQDWAFTVKASGCGSLQFCDMLRFSNRMVDEARRAKRVGSVCTGRQLDRRSTLMIVR
jgi:hypothetical protein